MSKLTDFRVAVLATDGFEESELTEPVKALKDAGAQVTILSLKPGQIQGVRHDLDKTVKVKVDRAIRDVSAEEFDAVHLPGGTVNADSHADGAGSSGIPAEDAGRRQAHHRHLSRAVGTGVGGAGARADADQLPHHPGRHPQRGRQLGGPGGRRGRQLGDQPPARRPAGVQPGHARPVLAQPGPERQVSLLDVRSRKGRSL